MIDTDLTQIPVHTLVEELRRRHDDCGLGIFPTALLRREIAKRRRAGFLGRPSHPMRDAIAAERAAGARVADLAQRYRVSVRTIARIAGPVGRRRANAESAAKAALP